MICSERALYAEKAEALDGLVWNGYGLRLKNNPAVRPVYGLQIFAVCIPGPDFGGKNTYDSCQNYSIN